MKSFCVAHSINLQHAWSDVTRYCKEHLSPGIILMRGDLGAGKTTFIQQFAHSLGYQGAVLSPTYNLISNYPSINLVHLDLYRIENPQELPGIGIDEYVDDSFVFIEWGDAFQDYLSPISAKINITLNADGLSRQIGIQIL